MSPLQKAALPLCATLLFLPLLQAQDVSDVDLTKIRQEVAAIKSRQEDQRQEALQAAVTELQTATKSPADAGRAYLDAIRVLEFEGKPNANGTFMDWKKSSVNVIGSHAFQQVVLVHLIYLQHTLQHASNPGRPADPDAILSYLKELVKARQLVGEADLRKWRSDEQNDFRRRTEELLDKPLEQSPFVQAYQMQSLIQGARDWEKSPGNMDQIIEQAVRGPLRKAKNPRLLETWDVEINFEKAIMAQHSTSLASDTLDQVILPNLRWRKAQDQMLLGQSGPALQEMLLLIKTYPSHPEWNRWLKEISAFLEGQPASTQNP